MFYSITSLNLILIIYKQHVIYVFFLLNRLTYVGENMLLDFIVQFVKSGLKR